MFTWPEPLLLHFFASVLFDLSLPLSFSLHSMPFVEPWVFLENRKLLVWKAVVW